MASITSLFKSSKKPQKLPLAAMIAAVVTDPAAEGYQPRNTMPLNPDTLKGFKNSGEWDPNRPALFVETAKGPVIIDGNNRTRYAHEAGYPEGWFVEVQLKEGVTFSDLALYREQANIHIESDAWTKAETWHDIHARRDLTAEEIAKNTQFSSATVAKHIKLYEIVRSFGKKAKAEETAEQKALRIKENAATQQKIIDGIRSGEISMLTVESLLTRDLSDEEFAKVAKRVLSAKQEKKSATKEKKVAANLDEYEELGVPKKFLPDLRARVLSRFKSEGDAVTQESQKRAMVAVIDSILGALPLENLLEGKFEIPTKAEEGAEDDKSDKEEESDEEEGSETQVAAK